MSTAAAAATATAAAFATATACACAAAAFCLFLLWPLFCVSLARSSSVSSFFGLFGFVVGGGVRGVEHDGGFVDVSAGRHGCFRGRGREK